MSRFRDLAFAALLNLLALSAALAEPLGLGRPATPEEIAAWDRNVMPDGRGLPAGSGNVWDGEEIFAEKCAACHGDFAEGIGNWPKLAGGIGTLAEDRPVKTVGSYWPYLTTAFDYIRRSMPYGQAQTLSDHDVYAVLAYILYSSDLVDDDFELNEGNVATFELPNRGGFIADDRAQTEYPMFTSAPCMRECKPPARITGRAAVRDLPR